MKTHLGKLIVSVITVIMILSLSVTALAADVGIDITAPSDAETTIAQGRNFYVLGTLKNGELLNDGDTVTVELIDENGVTVRRVSTSIKANRNMYVNYPGLSYYGKDRSELITAGMPDLIWDGDQLSSFHKGSIKLYYDDTEFAALVAGGNKILSDGMKLVDDSGYAYSLLPEGSYTVRVYVTDNTDVKNDDTDAYGVAEKQITIGNTADKLLSRFSPAKHMERITAFAKENGLRIYNDLFPGYWSKGDIFCEITSQWRAADAVEYASGKSHFIIYNVKSSSATYSVELSMLQRIAAIANENRLQCYYYTYGEPTLPDSRNTVSDIVPFAEGDRLQLVRAELTSAATKDNVYMQDKPEAESYDLDLSNGIHAASGETVSIYGVAVPIQLNNAELVDNGANAFAMDNKIATVRYNVSGEGVNVELEKAIKLNRISGGWDNYSEYEFKHDLAISEDMAGKTLTVSLAGYDVYGRKVEGTEETITLYVDAQASGGTLPPQTGDAANAELAGVLIAFAVMLVLAVRRRRA